MTCSRTSALAAAFWIGCAAGAVQADDGFRRGAAVLDVQAPATLALLEQAGSSLSALLGGGGAASLRDLHQASPAYRTLADAVRDDVDALRQEMKGNGRTLYEVTDQNVGRIIDLRWLQSPLASFRLVGVVNRIDRRDFAVLDGDSSCGEVRFIFRLAYRFRRGAATYASRMPFNINAVFAAPAMGDGACGDFARAWVPDRDLAEPKPQADWL